MNEITIIEYQPHHQPDFERLNRAWIDKYFTVEEFDRFVLQQPEEAILLPGGAIFMAECDSVIAGTVALRKISDDEFEFTKMAVDDEYKRKGIAEKLSHAALKKAGELGAKKVCLYSQTILLPALNLYKKLGFHRIPMDNAIYKRPDVKMFIDMEKYKSPEENLLKAANS